MSTAALLARDEASRRRALEPGSFIVEAPAGAGKTELLTQRVLMLLARVEAPEEIVAITFTRKAAAEMRGRVLESLERAAHGQVPEAAHKRLTFDLARAALAVAADRGWGLLENPARLRVTTIDAFCAGLARQMPLLSRFGGEPRVVDDPERHYREAARRTLGLLAGDSEALAAPVAAALGHLDNDTMRLSGLLVAMLGRRDQWLGHALNHPPVATARQALETLVARELAGIAGLIPGSLQEPVMAVARFAAANLPDGAPIAALRDWTRPLAGAPAELPLWRGLAELLLTKDDLPRRQLTKAIGLPPGKEAEAPKAALKAYLEAFPAAEALARVRRLPDPALDEADWATVTALATVLKLAAAQLWQVFREAGEVDFVEVAQRALAALGDPGAPTELALKLDYQISHLLVDEFQDTNLAQVELLARLTAGWAPGDGRSLFLVGDPMQSIYRFRKADVGLFLDTLARGIGGLPLERLHLTRNNRSRPAVVEWVNGAFGQLLPGRDAAEAGAIAYRPFAATREPEAGAGVFVHALVGPAETAAAREARRVLEIIDAARQRQAGDSVAVLVRAKRHLAPLVAEIRRHRPDLAFTAVEIEPLADRQPVQDLLSLAHALDHRADRVHWLAILRAPWCGLTLADLHALAGDDHRATIWSLIHDEPRLVRLSADGRARLEHLRGALAEAFAHRGRQRPRRWLEGTWLRLGGAACLGGATDAADVAAFLDLVDRLDAAGRYGPAALEEETAKLFATAEAGDGRLQFMSIHKAKGLEFDTVIVPGLHRSARGDDAPLLLWEPVLLADGRGGLVVAPLRRRAAEGPTAYDYLQDLERQRAGHEAERLLYVAATRARSSLHWVAALEPRADGELRPPAGSLLALLWPVVAGDFARAPVEEESPGGQDATPPPPLRRLAVPMAPAFARAPAGAGGPSASAAEAAAEGGDPLDADVGTLVHAYLEMIARDGLEAWPLARLEELAPAMEVWFAQRGHGEAEARRGTGRSLESLAATLGSESGRWVLAPRPQAAAELALVKADAGGTSTHIVDRTFVEAGVRWILDYKTARVAGDGDALRAHAERYRPQLERYAGLFAGEGLPVRAAIYYTTAAALVELEGLRGP